MLARRLDWVDGSDADADIAAVDEQIEAFLVPFAAAARRLDEIPGINSSAGKNTGNGSTGGTSKHHHVRQLEALSYTVTLTPAA